MTTPATPNPTTTTTKEDTMPTKTKTDQFQDALTGREKAIIEKVASARESLATERESLSARQDAVEAAQEAVDSLEGLARAGDPEVTGKALVEARGDAEVAAMALDGSQKRIKRFADFLGKSNTRKDIAEIVRDTLTQRMIPGVASYSTFASGGFAKDSEKPENLPALVVTQLDGGIGAGGVGSGKVRIAFHRPGLYAPMDPTRLRAALEGAGFRIGSRGFGSGLDFRTAEGMEVAEAHLMGVSDETPVVTNRLSSVDGWDTSLALELGTDESMEVEACGAQISSVDEDQPGTLTTKVRLSVAVKQANPMDDLNLKQIVKGKAEAKYLNMARGGAGRCIEVDVRLASSKEGDGRSVASKVIGSRDVYAVQFTYMARLS